LILGGMVVLALHIVHSHYPYRQQAILIFAGALLPFLVNIPSTFNLLPRDFPPLDLSALAGVATGVCWGWALFRYQLLDILPVARDAVLESMADGVIVLDTRNRMVDINPAAERMFSLTRAAVVGKPLAAYLVNRPDVWERFAAVSEAATEITLGEATTARIFDLRISTLYRKRAPAGRLIVLRDITERQQAAEALQQYTQELEARNAELDAFAHTVAHDLKNPLSAVVGFTSYLVSRRGKVEEEQQMTMLNTIQRQGYRMARIIDELLLFASLRKLGEVAFSALDMGQIVAEVQERLAAAIEEKQAHLTLPATWPTPVGYAAWVEEILANYLSNALKYGGTPPHIVLGWEAQGERLRFWVQDDGAGLTPEEQARLFIPFTRLDQVSAKGHGLGLSIVRRISEKLGGEVGVESAPGQGSAFWFTLPAAEPAASDSNPLEMKVLSAD
jgi:PAS domain S-box-containing protein